MSYYYVEIFLVIIGLKTTSNYFFIRKLHELVKQSSSQLKPHYSIYIMLIRANTLKKRPTITDIATILN